MKRKVILASCLLLSVGVFSQKKWTLKECVEYAIENNIEIKQQELQVKSSEISLNTSKMSRLPDLNANVGQNFGFGRSQTASGVYESQNSSSTSLGISTSIPLFTGLRIHNEIKRDELNLRSNMEGLKKARENKEIQIATLYLEILFKKEILKVNEEQVGQTLEQVGKTEILLEAGKVPESQLYEIKAQLAKDELSVVEAKNSLNLALLDLSQALNMIDNQGFDIVEPNLGDIISKNISSILAPNIIYEEAVAVKPHVKEYEYRLEGDKRSLKVAKSAYWPTLSLGMGYNTQYYHVNGAGRNPLTGRPINRSFSTQFKDNSRESIGFSLSIPLFNRLATRNNVKLAQVQISNRMLDLENVKLALYKEIQQAYQNAVSSEAKFSATQKAYKSADEAFKYMKEKYAVGKATVFEYNEAKFKLISSQSEQIQSKYDFLFRAKILDFYRGVPITID